MCLTTEVSDVEELARAIAQARTVLAFTGAGISTGSGIPDFRGPKGLWKTEQPVYFDEFMASEEARTRYWAQKVRGFEAFMNARPNAAHSALVELEGLDRLDTLVTQNIDGLHHDAGQSPARIIEIHGTNRWIECVSCRERTRPDPWIARFKETGRAPVCACGGFLKTATISFGQAMNEADLMRAFEAAERSDLVLAVGSTLEVHPAASIPLAAMKSGARYAIVNMGPTAHDEIAWLRLEGNAVDVLPAVVLALGKELEATIRAR
jgi:NAD-dependent deacetylase